MCSRSVRRNSDKRPEDHRGLPERAKTHNGISSTDDRQFEHGELSVWNNSFVIVWIWFCNDQSVM